MGNINTKSSTSINKNIVNTKCPICLLKFDDKKINEDEEEIIFNNTDDNVETQILECNHKMHLNCASLLCKDIITNTNEILCPLCREKISSKIINKILKNTILDINVIDPTEWTRKRYYKY